MKRLALLALLLIAPALLHAQKPDKKPHPPHPVFNTAPVAAFTFGCVGISCQFVFGSSDSDGTITGWLWKFGDGVSSIELNPSHTYGNGGTFTVTLEVIDNGGLISRTTRAVTVTAAPPPDTVQPNVAPVASLTIVCDERTCTYTDHSTDLDGIISTRTLDFGDATGTSGLAVSTHTYSVSGTYTATLEVCDDDGLCASTTRAVTVATLPPPATTYILTKTLGDNQTWAIGGPLPVNFRVLLTDAAGNAIAGDTIYWAVTSGGGTLNRAFSVTDAFANSLGWAYARLTLGPVVGTQTATARHAKSGLLVTFTATATATTPPPVDTTTPPPPPPPPPPTGTGATLAAATFEDGTLGDFVTSGAATDNCVPVAGTTDLQCSTDMWLVDDPTGQLGGRVLKIRYPRTTLATKDVNRSIQWDQPAALRTGFGQCVTFTGRLYVPTPRSDMVLSGRKLLYWFAGTGAAATNHTGMLVVSWRNNQIQINPYTPTTGNYIFEHGLPAAQFFDHWHSLKFSLRVNSSATARDGQLRWWLNGVEPVLQNRFAFKLGVPTGLSPSSVMFIDQPAGTTLPYKFNRVKVGEQVNDNDTSKPLWTEVRYWDNPRFSDECP